MEHPVPAEVLVRPWRRATIVATLIAAAELVVLVFAGVALLARPLLDHFQATAPAAGTARVHAATVHHAKAMAPAPVHRARALPKPPPVGIARIPRSRTTVAVLNGFGRNGAAGDAARQVRAKGYPVVSVADARKMGSPATLVLYQAGYRAEGARLAHDLHVRIFAPLDGVRPGDVRTAKVVLVVGR